MVVFWLLLVSSVSSARRIDRWAARPYPTLWNGGLPARAILNNGIAAFSKMMEKNEARTLELLLTHNALIEGVVASTGQSSRRSATLPQRFQEHRGRAQTRGNPVQAVRVQQGERRFAALVRIGFHLGDFYFYENGRPRRGIIIAARSSP
jgi:hypothetical protein